MTSSNNSYQPLNISIVGAGIGGLTAAIALKKNGHNVQIFETAEIKTEIGAAVAVQANSLRVLDHLGVSKENLKGVPWKVRRGNNQLMLIPEMQENGLLCHRSDLYEELKRLATGEGEGPPAILRLGTTIVASDPEQGTVTLKGGEIVDADCILGADGIHPGRPTATREEFIAKFPKFHPKFLSFLDLPIHDSIHRWKLRVLPHLPTWVRGRAALLGDAAHGTLPLLGQGAGMAIEDGGSLGCLLPAGTRREDIPARLEAYQRLRTERGEFVNTESVAQLSKGFNLVKAKDIQSYLRSYDAMKAAEECYRDHFGTGVA
ncbi:hypothetical protein B0H14DRAFT_3482016 [Mycena olivaceomarginata]|nr:hypothetical protein B0H14DRAFT_3482016 [Mycena olivaceomarginata]